MLTISSVWTGLLSDWVSQRRIHPKTGSTLAIKVPPLSPDPNLILSYVDLNGMTCTLLFGKENISNNFLFNGLDLYVINLLLL